MLIFSCGRENPVIRAGYKSVAVLVRLIDPIIKSIHCKNVSPKKKSISFSTS